MDGSAPTETAPPQPLVVPARPFVAGLLLGLPVAFSGIALLVAVSAAQDAIWDDLPRAVWSTSEPPWWYVLAIPAIAGVGSAMLLGRMANPPREHSLSITPTPPRELLWLVAAALVTLAGGLVVGPEAPLLALGVTLGGIGAHLSGTPERAWQMSVVVAGAFATLATLVASPLAALVLLFEIVAASGAVPSRSLVPVLIPGLVSGGVAILLFTGINEWAGFTVPEFAIPHLPAYTTVQIADLAWAPGVAVVATAVVVACQHVDRVASRVVDRRPVVFTALVGVGVGAMALLWRGVAGHSIDDVLFSGEHSLPDYVELSAGTGIFLLLILCKGLGYALSLAGRFEGGPIFPAIALGCAAGMGASALPGAHVVPMVAVGIAAAATSVQRLPIFGMVFATLMVGSGALLSAAPFTILGGLVGWIVAMRWNRSS